MWLLTENRSFFELCSLALATRTPVHCRHQHDDDALIVITTSRRPSRPTNDPSPDGFFCS